MFKKKTKSEAAILANLIAKMQKNGDLVEKNILDAEDLLFVDVENDEKQQPFQHQEEVSYILREMEGLLKELFLDVDKVKNLKHPQAQEIEDDITKLHERWMKNSSGYKDIYEQPSTPSPEETDSEPAVIQNETSPLLTKMNQIKLFDDDSLVDWMEINKGGYGSVYKASHKKMGHDVAIKILHDVSVEESLLKEATFQKVFSCNHVLRIYGMYEGTPPNKKVKQEGIVMQFMIRGSIKDLCKNLEGPPPFPLACRLIQEVALGMRFLHSMGILHRDLKLQNVMLCEDLHAKLADFGLCTMSVTCCPNSEEETENLGTVKYMPPEAYDISYKPVRSFDVYSFAIFLWSILSGEEPFPTAKPNRLQRCVADGQRPPLVELLNRDEAGMTDLLELMQSCWDADPTKRPTFEEITPTVQTVYSNHKGRVHHEVFTVLEKLDGSSSSGYV
ncbi:hypothetical protein OJAV_G00010640 [Oryzias javanicus]|uniref:Protein kinase domain-containing protein n=1 Tax=Oryzias javanicus TaxID=123683 RepID=A0A3S2PLE1_ORYJA|nr:hypothetical protein OJAV_G00010640 [Oryzias javanicus]